MSEPVRKKKVVGAVGRRRTTQVGKERSLGMTTPVAGVAVEERDLESILKEMDPPLDEAAMEAGFLRLQAAMARDERFPGRLIRWLARALGLLSA